MFTIENLDKSKLTELSTKHLGSMCSDMFGKSIEDASSADIETILNVDISALPMEFTISAGSTRQLERQYNSHNYHASQKLDSSYYRECIASIISNEALSVEQRINKYFEFKVQFYSTIKTKILNNENFLRHMLRSAEETDGIDPLGRFA